MSSWTWAREFSPSNRLQNFKGTFEDARALFLENLSSLQNTDPHVRHRLYEIPNRTEETLPMDSVYLPPKSGKKQRLLILTSGIHGVEGFVGSALQNQFIKENFWQLRDDQLGLLIIHGLNPYGFKHKRRVTENNVDLNRNLATSRSLFELKNDGYEKVRALLNPPEAATSGWWDRSKFYGQCLVAILQHSMDSLRRAILRGQYQEPQGIYFGGRDFEPQKEILENEILEVAAGYEKVLLVDLHTGYGRRGHLHLFADRAPEIEAPYLEKIFAGFPLDFGQKKDFYETTGGFVVFAGKLLQKKTRYAGVVFEFGTLDSQKTLGSLDSLYRMVRENQKFHHGDASNPQDSHLNDLFLEMFYPSDPQWREGVSNQFQEVLSAALRNQKALN